MKHRWIIPLVVLALLSLACSFTKLVKKPTETPPKPAVVQPTQDDKPLPADPTSTAVPEPVEPTEVLPAATEESCYRSGASNPAYYTETFDGSNECWDFSSVSPSRYS
jgi:hypothetical protein